ncbi:hypothetical protein SASPL_130604 [Salvia splendens]|uniref:DUF7734 domain-containing protein n=1 Tax=Salvia splendens TaxID=180675 RepID=A0A8X8ZK66_SALSN|nr:uncharacterized protein LOC121755399 [Salvia splendens]KAG6407608.1 hypothetical protein SASPL_130604 [Salvia splendens]
MLKQLGKWTSNSMPLFPHPNTFSYTQTAPSYSSPVSNIPLKIRIKRANETLHRARRRVIYEDEDYGYNEELAMLESYTQLVKDEILLVQAMVDDEQVEVLIYKGFSSCLNYGTSSDPSRSVLPAKARVRSIDRARGPFDPSNIEYIERAIPFPQFQTRLHNQK